MAVAEGNYGRLGPQRHTLHDGDDRPARPGGVGDARRDAGDRAVAGLRRQHRPAFLEPVERAAGVGRLRPSGRSCTSSSASPGPGNGRLAVVPQLPPGAPDRGSDIRLGAAARRRRRPGAGTARRSAHPRSRLERLMRRAAGSATRSRPEPPRSARVTPRRRPRCGCSERVTNRGVEVARARARRRRAHAVGARRGLSAAGLDRDVGDVPDDRRGDERGDGAGRWPSDGQHALRAGVA